MATNKRQAGADPVMTIRAEVTSPGTPASGDPVMVGTLPGVALTDEDATSGETTVDIGPSIFSLEVVGEAHAADEAIVKGDTLYYDSGEINRDSVDGEIFGIALGTVSEGATVTIDVLIGKGVSVNATGS